MEAKELRIGNWCIDDEENYVVIEQVSGDRVHEFAKVSRLTARANRLHYSSNVFAIPLTEEILMKAGFTLIDGYGHRTQYGWIHKVNGEYYWKYYQLEVNVNAVHLLQNTYERFYQKELEINL